MYDIVVKYGRDLEESFYMGLSIDSFVDTDYLASNLTELTNYIWGNTGVRIAFEVRSLSPVDLSFKQNPQTKLDMWMNEEDTYETITVDPATSCRTITGTGEEDD